MSNILRKDVTRNVRFGSVHILYLRIYLYVKDGVLCVVGSYFESFLDYSRTKLVSLLGQFEGSSSYETSP